MAEFSPVLPMRDGGGRFGQPIFPRSRSGSESESELSQSLARTKIRSYGSTASVTASLGEKYIEHRVTDSDTLQGIALKYGVTMEQIKRANKLFSNDCIFLRNSLNIPVPQPQPEELSAKDFLHRLDLQIKQSKQAARRLKEEEIRSSEEDYTAPTTSYQEI
ncbi:lysM and putative peptidoglycan-binding domain-containing protein 2 [Lates japonicus]|uniref:LysM and putative peptidoglycan-binding domain-containing protein 2 n=1 Tax=Lates japonicus TaxID=270547 RepID=A0AAD3MLX7_LATJO|nr:lysM and putative peptidoglycan-binding domain-containing protein 2 [Lates japonicus]